MNTVKLNYKRLGQGQPLIILHGLFGSLDNWMTLAKAWSEEYEVWIVDQRNHGKSPHANDHSYELMASDLYDFFNEHKLEHVNLLGHSMGGKTAMEFAMHHDELIEKLVVVDIAPVAYEVNHWAILGALGKIDPANLKSRNEAEELLQADIKEIGIRQFLLKNLYRSPEGGYAWRFNFPVLRDEIIPISEWAVSEGVFEKPTLFVKGQNSPYILPESASRISLKFPEYSLEEFPNAGHWVHAESPKRFFEVVSTFLKT